MSDLSESEKNQFFQRLGFRNGKPMVERRDGGPIVSVDGRPPGWKAEYRTGHRALAPRRRTAGEYRARIAALEERCREVDRMLEALAD